MCKCVCFSSLHFCWLNVLFLTDSSTWVRYGTVRSPPSPYQYTGSPHIYAAPVDYGTPHPGVHPGTPGAIYGSLGPHVVHFYNHGAQFSRHQDGDAIVLCSPILEEFCTNRSHKWELCVSASIITHLLNFIFIVFDRTFMVMSWSLVVTSMVHDLFSRSSKLLQVKRSR